MNVFLASLLVLVIGTITVKGRCTNCACIDASDDLSCVHGVCEQDARTLDVRCNCLSNWEGPRCNIAKNQQGQVSDACADNPCNSGHCNIYGTTYTCTCLRYFTGATCDTPTDLEACSSNPCTSSAKPNCINLAAGYRCVA